MTSCAAWLTLQDSGGTASGGQDTSPSQSFIIFITKPQPEHDARNALDVTDDTHVAADDALAVINYINAFGSTSVIPLAPIAAPFYDVTADNSIAPDDALSVINAINSGLAAKLNFQWTESSITQPTKTSDGQRPASISNELIGLLGLDVASSAKRRR